MSIFSPIGFASRQSNLDSVVVFVVNFSYLTSHVLPKNVIYEKHFENLLSLSLVFSLLNASEFEIDYTARFSVGITGGIGATSDEISKISASTLSSGKYEVKSGVNLEVPLIISARGEGLLYFIAAPALVYSQNTNQVSYRYLTVNPGNTAAVVNVDGDEKLTQMGGKLYAGIGYGRALGWHAELLPYIGFSSVKEEGTTLTSIRSTDTSSQQGSFTSYGITVGGYYTPEFAKYLEFGARLGYAGSTGKIDGRDFEQNDLIAALELGLHF